MTFDAIPKALADLPQWLVWKFEPGEKKPKKVPYWARGGKRTGGAGSQGSERDRSMLTTLPGAIEAMRERGMSGVGFAFLPGDGLIGIDLDRFIDPESGEVSPVAAEIISRCNSYTEYSQSKTGVHIIVKGNVKTFKSDDIGVEVFCGSQFFICTGDRYSGTPEDVRELDGATLDWLHAMVEKAKADRRGKATVNPIAPVSENVEMVAQLQAALAYINPDCEYQDWLKVGMGLFNELGEGGRRIWDFWSSSGQKYENGASLDKHWASFRNGCEPTRAFIFSLAKRGGFKPPPPPGSTRRTSSVPKSANSTPAQPASTPPEGAAAPETDGKVVDMAAAREKKAADKKEKEEKAEKKKRPPPPPEFLEKVDRLLKRFTLIYTTDAAYDHEVHVIIRVAAMRLAFGKDPVSYWLHHSQRRMVNLENVVFDPTEKVGGDTHVNLFHGMPLKPDINKPHDKLLALLFYLCGENDAVYDWVLKWLALPLQRQGTKMESAILIHGDEGSGKNQFFNAIRKIYGAYSTIITQKQLESEFNAWASRRLFLIANEVVSASEIRDQKGLLKNYITEPVLQINEKMLPLREESNHMQFVFFSNESIPLLLDNKDRRYQVIWTPDPMPDEYYREVGAQIDAGAAEGLYAYLLQYPLGDFDEHTKPIMTVAKQNLINLSKKPSELFYDAWVNDLLPLPILPAVQEDLYKAFLRWCYLNGERHPPTSTKFGATLGRLKCPSKIERINMLGGTGKAPQRTVYYPCPPPPEYTHDQDRRLWMNDSVQQFRSALVRYCSGDTADT